MDALDLMLKDFDYAAQRYRDMRTVLDKAISLFGTLIIAITTFIVRRDLPQEAYLIVAAALLVAFVHIGMYSYKQSCASGATDIAEMRIREWVKRHGITPIPFDMTKRFSFLRDGEPHIPRVLRQIHRLLLYTVLLAFYFFALCQGLMAATQSHAMRTAGVLIGLLLLAFFAYVGWLSNSYLKKRYTIAVEEAFGSITEHGA